MSIPGVPDLLRSEWLYKHRHWLGKNSFLAPAEVMINSMHRIKQVSAQMLQEKVTEAAAIASGDSSLAGKKDIMSLLVQARTQEKNSSGSGGAKMTMSDSMMMEQVVSIFAHSFRSSINVTLPSSSPSWAQGTKPRLPD